MHRLDKESQSDHNKGENMNDLRLMPEYEIITVTDNFILIIDLNKESCSVTNGAEKVIEDLNKKVSKGIGKRKVYYRDSDNRFDELKVEYGKFVDFVPCTKEQQLFFANLVNRTK